MAPAPVKPYDMAKGGVQEAPEHKRTYIEKHMESKRIIQAGREVGVADNRNIAGFHPVMKDTIHPVICKHAQGSYVIDADDNKFFDIAGGFGPILFGHNPPCVQGALSSMLDNGTWGLGLEHELVHDVAQKVCEVTGMDRVAFVNTGTEATTLAMRLCKLKTKKSKIVMFEGSYHGHFDGWVSERHCRLDRRAVRPGSSGANRRAQASAPRHRSLACAVRLPGWLSLARIRVRQGASAPGVGARPGAV